MATPSERSTHARIAANTRWANEPDRAAATAAARRNSPSSLEYWVAKTDPELSREERVKRAKNLKKAHFEKLALAGRKARAAKKAAAQQRSDAA